MTDLQRIEMKIDVVISKLYGERPRSCLTGGPPHMHGHSGFAMERILLPWEEPYDSCYDAEGRPLKVAP